MPQPVTIQRQTAEPTECFTCLGSNIELTHFVVPPQKYTGVSATMAGLSTVWHQAKLSLNTKLRLYKALILCVLLYGCETWTLLKADEWKLEASHMSCQRQIGLLGVRWYHFVSKASVIKQTGQDSLCSQINSRRPAVFGLVCRLVEDVPAHTALSLAVKASWGHQPAHCRCSLGCSCHSWTTQIELDRGHCADLAWYMDDGDRRRWRVLRLTASQACEWVSECVSARCKQHNWQTYLLTYQRGRPIYSQSTWEMHPSLNDITNLIQMS